METVIVSVAMATYNGEKFLREQLDSLYAQTRKPDEIVVSDDNSTDGTTKILEEYRVKCGLKYEVNSKSLGVNKNFEKAIRACKGNYVMICDQDDVWLPNKIEQTLNYMHYMESVHGTDSPILITSEAKSFVKPEEVILTTKPCLGTITDYKDFLFNTTQYCQGCTMMMNRQLLDKVPSFPDFFKVYPYDAHISVISILLAHRCHVLQPMMYYRHHDNNVVAKLGIPSRKERIYERIADITYSFFDIPYPRQNYYCRMVTEYKIEVEDNEVKKDIDAIVKFASSYYFGKIKAIFSVCDMDIKRKWKQMARTTLTYPLRLFVSVPKI